MGKDGRIERWEPFTRFVLNQDTGGAITGPGRVDLFWGEGAAAEAAAGNLQHEGELFFLAPKSN
jgi:membrane-bound lytic murein transglycosylase A